MSKDYEMILIFKNNLHHLNEYHIFLNTQDISNKVKFFWNTVYNS